MPHPFSLENDSAYRDWRARKLDEWPADPAELIVPIQAPEALDPSTHARLLDRIRRANMVVYQLDPTIPCGRDTIRAFGRQFGLERLDGHLCADHDGISALEVRADGGRGAGEYIPYSDRPINWHTDGYYNGPAQQIRGMILHCVHTAADGGENALLDPEIAYIHLRDTDPALIRALMRDDAMTIPANVVDGIELRGAVSGPVFSVDPHSGTLHMRYTARARNVIWADETAVQAARTALTALLETSDAPYVVRHRLSPGEGLLCNNVLHNRSGFRNSPEQQRLLWRARYYDRIVVTP